MPPGKKAAKGRKKKAGLPPLAPEQEELLAAAACCLRHLTAGSACDAARVALAGGAEALVLLLDSGRLQLRQAAKVRLARLAGAARGCRRAPLTHACCAGRLPQDVLCNLSMVAQLAPLLAKAGMPEELAAQVGAAARAAAWLVRRRRLPAQLLPARPRQVPMKLGRGELAALAREFPAELERLLPGCSSSSVEAGTPDGGGGGGGLGTPVKPW